MKMNVKKKYDNIFINKVTFIKIDLIKTDIVYIT